MYKIDWPWILILAFKSASATKLAESFRSKYLIPNHFSGSKNDLFISIISKSKLLSISRMQSMSGMEIFVPKFDL